MREKNKKIFQHHGKLVTIIYIICQILIFTTLFGTILTTIFTEQSLGKMFEHVFLCALSLLLINLPRMTQRKYKVKIPDFMQAVITAFIVAHFILGEIYRMYDYSLIFDKVLHTTSGVIIAMVGFSLIEFLNDKHIRDMKLSPIFIALFSFCFALATAMLWEVFEFTMDSILGINMQRWQDELVRVTIDGQLQWVAIGYQRSHGLVDTMGDMIVSTIGALIVCSMGYVWLRTQSQKIDRFIIQRNVTPFKEETVNQDNSKEEQKEVPV